MRVTSFQRLALTTTVLTYLLIAVGGIVRASGSGLGCPDWPHCFGSWIPPVSAADLPPQFDAAKFNVVQTWTEYVNRLLGVSVGFAIVGTAVAAWWRHRRQPRIVWPVIAAMLLTGFEGWLGGRVVAHALAPWIVTAHLVVALLIVQLLLWATVEAFADGGPASTVADAPLGWAAWAVTALVLLQIALGTQVRGGVDDALEHLPRDQALAAVGRVDGTHRDTAALVALAVIGLWAWTWQRHGPGSGVLRAATLAGACVVLKVVAGMALTGLGLPPPVQVTHLTVASLLLGALTWLALLAWRIPRAGSAAAR